MDSRYELSLPNTTTPVKLEPNGENILCSSPSLQPEGDIASMINTGGTPIASLKTPTKVLMSQNSAGRHTMTISPTRLYVKHADADHTNQKVPVPIASDTRNAATVAAPTYQSSKTAQKPHYLRIVSNHENGQPTASRQNPNLHFQGNVQHGENFHHQVAPAQHQQSTAPSQTIINRPLNGGGVGQRVLLPAGNTQTLRISGSQSLAHIQSQLPPGTTILSSSDSSGQMLALLPNNHTVMPKQVTMPKQLYADGGQMTASPQGYRPRPQEAVVSMPSNNTQGTAPQPQTTSAPDVNKQKKPCNCTKSQCLKLYCDCFANGEFCSNCNCHNCFNNLDHEEERQKAVKQCLERNPQAFHPKIGKSTKADARRHQKGCNCKRSGCLKNYCECYEAKIPCGSMCKCVGCKNSEGHDHKGLMRLADAADMRHSQLPHERNTFLLEAPTPHSYLKKPVIEAVIDCLIAQCREAETAKCKDSTTEKVILEEYGRCLSELIKASQSGRAV